MRGKWEAGRGEARSGWRVEGMRGSSAPRARSHATLLLQASGVSLDLEDMLWP